MTLKQLMDGLFLMQRDAPHLLKQTARLTTDDGVIDIVLVNVYGDERVIFIPDWSIDDASSVDETEPT